MPVLIYHTELIMRLGCTRIKRQCQ